MLIIGMTERKRIMATIRATYGGTKCRISFRVTSPKNLKSKADVAREISYLYIYRQYYPFFLSVALFIVSHSRDVESFNWRWNFPPILLLIESQDFGQMSTVISNSKLPRRINTVSVFGCWVEKQRARLLLHKFQELINRPLLLYDSGALAYTIANEELHRLTKKLP